MANYRVKLDTAPAGHQLPALLREFGAFVAQQKHGGLGAFDALRADAIPPSWNEARARALQAAGFAFLHLPDGGLVALLKPAGRSAPAVVLLGSDGEARTLADSLEAFLSKWAKGATGVMELDDDAGTTGRKALGAWLKSKKVKAPRAKPFDFAEWLDGDDGPPPTTTSAPASLGADPARLKGLGPRLQQLAAIVGRRVDDPVVSAYVTKVLRAKVPATTSDRDDSLNVEAGKLGVELVCSHRVLHVNYPPVPKTNKTFVPYVTTAFVGEAFPEPVLGVPWSATLEEVTKRLGKPTGKRAAFATDDDETVTYWERDLGGGVRLDVSYEDSLRVVIELSNALGLDETVSASTALFFAWAAAKNLLDESAFGPHAALVASLRQRKANPDEVAKVALPRGLWDSHLKKDPKLRITAYRWFRNMKGLSRKNDLIAVFGKRKGPTGLEEPKLDEASWAAVDKASKVLASRFAA